MGAHTSVGQVFTGGESVGALAPLSLASSSSVDGNFGIASFVPSRSMKLGQLNFFWKFVSFYRSSPLEKAGNFSPAAATAL
jgi:hypothetical protein